jgi:hypothetical protein
MAGWADARLALSLSIVSSGGDDGRGASGRCACGAGDFAVCTRVFLCYGRVLQRLFAQDAFVPSRPFCVSVVRLDDAVVAQQNNPSTRRTPRSRTPSSSTDSCAAFSWKFPCPSSSLPPPGHPRRQPQRRLRPAPRAPPCPQTRPPQRASPGAHSSMSSDPHSISILAHYFPDLPVRIRALPYLLACILHIFSFAAAHSFHSGSPSCIHTCFL